MSLQAASSPVGQRRLACQLPGGSSMYGALPTPFPTLTPPFFSMPLGPSLCRFSPAQVIIHPPVAPASADAMADAAYKAVASSLPPELVAPLDAAGKE